jgi:hypothetical protein
MEGIAGFNADLQASLEKYRDYIERSELTKLKEQYRILHTAFKALYNILLKKGLIHEDPYKQDTKISEISNPPDGHFLDSEKDDRMSIRLSVFESQLDFLLNYYQFSVEFLDLARIKLLAGLTRYITWDQFSEVSSNMTTRSLAEYVGKIKKGGDNLSANIITDALEQVQKAAKSCITILKETANYHKEIYKFEVRLSILPHINLDPARALAQKEETLRQIKKRFPQDLPGKPFFPELILEILEEDYGPDSEELKKTILNRIAIKEEKSKTDSQEISFSAMILEAIRTLAAASRYLDEAIQKLSDNSTLLENRALTLGERFKRWIEKLTQKGDNPLTYTVEYFDITTSSTKHENIEFNIFTEEVRKKARLYGGIMSKTSTVYKKMEKVGEDQLYAFLDKHIEELNIIYRRLGALDTFFKTEVDREQRANLRGIKIELTAIKNNIVKTHQKKHDYIARKDEIEQMKKLGINTKAD